MAGGTIDDFLAALAVDRGAAANTLDAYARDLEGAAQLVGPLETASREDLAGLADASGSATSSVARRPEP